MICTSTLIQFFTAVDTRSPLHPQLAAEKIGALGFLLLFVV